MKRLLFTEVSSAHQTGIYLTQSTARTVKFGNILLFKWPDFYWIYLKIVIYSCDFKAEFLASLLQSHDPSEIILIFWFAAQKNIYVENSE